MTESNVVRHIGPRVGDRVQVEARGRLVELQDREGRPGALIGLDDGGIVWVPREALVLLRQPVN
jgi:hypothetical protein